MVWVGTISYGVYVYHMVIAGLVPIVGERYGLWLPFPAEHGWMRLLAMVATTLPVAAASWYWFEKPINDLKAKFPYVPQPRQPLPLSERALA
jgi:peptidoglycan/LPS O-acetylase OafA/YrhL